MESNLHRAIAGLRPDSLPTCLQRLLTPRTSPRQGRAVVDLVLLVEPRDFQKATLVSMFEAALRRYQRRACVADRVRGQVG